MGIVSFWISPGFIKIVILTTVFLFFEGKQLFFGALNQTFPGLWKDLTIPLLLEYVHGDWYSPRYYVNGKW